MAFGYYLAYTEYCMEEIPVLGLARAKPLQYTVSHMTDQLFDSLSRNNTHLMGKGHKYNGQVKIEENTVRQKTSYLLHVTKPCPLSTHAYLFW